jgi:(2Fe-2S) ferredoxin
MLICVGPNCDAEGKGRALRAKLQIALEAAFPEELKAGRIVCATRDCLRLCTRDPVVRFEPSGDAYSNPTVDDLLRITGEAFRTHQFPPEFYPRT